MSSTVDDEQSAESLKPGTAKTSATSRRAKGRRRRKPEGNSPRLVLVRESPFFLDLAPPSQSTVIAPRIQKFELPCPENVQSLAKYAPRCKTYGYR